MNPTDPIAAIATAAGRGAIGIIRISGADLQPLIQSLCGRDLRPREATYLPFLDSKGDPIDQCLAIFFPAPRSFTGEDVLELQAHGGPVVLQLILSRCFESASETARLYPGRLKDLRLAQPGEFTQRAFLNGKLDLAQAEAVADLIEASTEAAARSAGKSLSGVFSREIGFLNEGLIELRMLIEATLDFPEEEIDFLEKADARSKLLKLQQRMQRVRNQTHQGVLMRDGIKVVIAGQPNAGKSSLLNALAGMELAIVTPFEGTTRDKIQQTIQIEGIPVHVIDTAGLRDSVDPVEQIGIEKSWQEIDSADVVLFLHDLTRMDLEDYGKADEIIRTNLMDRLSERIPVLNVWNKEDARALQPPDGQLALSAKTGKGVDALRKKLLDIVGWQTVPEGVFIARARHVEALTQVDAHLVNAALHLREQAKSLEVLAEELRLAQNALNQITGKFNADDLLGVIFSKFCIGK